MNKIQKAMIAGFSAATLTIGALATEDPNPPDFAAGGAATNKPTKECYDFSKLTEGRRYEKDDTIQADKALIEMKQFMVAKGEPTQMADPFIEVRGSAIARETAPELWMNQLNVKVTPNRPVNRVSIQFAENVNSLLANVAVNDRKRVVDGGLSQLNGKVLGKKGNRAVFVVNYDSTSTGGGYNRGELRLHATKGKIHNWTIGGQHLFIDNVCFY